MLQLDDQDLETKLISLSSEVLIYFSDLFSGFFPLLFYDLSLGKPFIIKLWVFNLFKIYLWTMNILVISTEVAAGVKFKKFKFKKCDL